MDLNCEFHSSNLSLSGISKSGCWDVIYTSRRVCALPGDFKDLREEHQFAGRVEYVGNKLRIKELKISDSGEYRFRLITDLEQYSGSPGVILTVTDAQVKSSPSVVSEGQEVILSCSTKCTLNDKHTYIWYKNGRQVTDGFTKDNKLYLDSVSNEELHQYSCAVGDPVDSTAFSHYTVTLLVFLPQFLIIVALWMWYFIRISFQNQKENKNEILMFQMSSSTSAVCPSEPLE
ncbi:sialoadhesin-like [Sinocyclocheilus grahami]|uniref:sialoadhesin-like n=1 Tax=Sinocyclocheilus grahami TaxID=75366 RepID=UPI0007AD4E59|nr:PREDICTED: sialoadhesin-like [Sinocyclocheilus grahami]